LNQTNKELRQQALLFDGSDSELNPQKQVCMWSFRT